MELTIHALVDLSEQVRSDVLNTSVALFETGLHSIEWMPEGDWQITIWESGTWVCVVQVFEQVVFVHDQRIPVAGVGNVMTRPEYRGRGYASAAMRRAMEFIRYPMGVDFGLLFCTADLMPFYQRFGWQSIGASTRYLQTDGYHIFADYQAMVWSVTQRIWPYGQIDLRGWPW